MSEGASRVLEAPGDAALVLAPAMDSGTPPVWSGARWIGSLDVLKLPQCPYLELKNHAGYERARLLVREGAGVRGFVDVEAPGGVLERRVLDEAVAALPPVASFPPGPAPSGTAEPPITVVVCTRDRASLLRSALTTILALDYANFDVLVVDNAARTSETVDLVRSEFGDPRIRLISEPTPGLSHARNTGLRHATGEFVAYTDDDVVVDAGWLRGIAAAFEHVPAAVCVTGLVPAGELRSPAQGFFDQRVSWSRSVTPKIYSLADPPAGVPKFPFSPGVFGTGANFALDRRAALAMGGFDPALGVGTRTGGGEDIDMFTRVILEGYSLVVQPSAIVWHRHRESLDELRVQARGYGTGLGAWLTKILLNPETARLALSRAPHVVRAFIQSGAVSHKPMAQPSPGHDSWEYQLARVLQLEMYSLARGPVNYGLERWAGSHSRSPRTTGLPAQGDIGPKSAGFSDGNPRKEVS